MGDKRVDTKKISIIIPNYNGKVLLQKNLPSVISAAKSYDSKTEIIVVDDNSNDQSVFLIQKTYPQILVYVNDKNYGFSTTCNRGVRMCSGDIVLLLNTDISPEKNFINPLLKHFDDPNCFAVSCLDLSFEKNKEIERGRGIGKFARGFLIHQRGEINKTTTLWASGGSSAFDKKKWIELGGFDESFNPFYWEDIDLSYRAQKNGWMVWFEKESVVHHRHEEGVIRNQYSAENIQEIAYKNQIIFMWKNITDLSLQISHLFWLPYHLLKAFFNFDFSFIKAFVDALLCMVVIIRNRMRNQKSFVSDQEIVDKYKLEFK